MNQGFYRKVAYLIALAALLWPMSWLGAPSTADSAGGKLAQLRSEADLGQADLGAIDPASEALRVALLGLRGPAVTMLWNKANHYKKVEDWAEFQATLEQLSRLQPYFVKVWQYQAWNLTYNVSVELDDYRNRFFYVKQGIKYLKEGNLYLRDNPTLLDDLGWFCGNKVGRADEKVEYRRLFRLDDELHPADVSDADRDNWLVSKVWYELAISSIDDKKQPLGTKNPVTFFDSPARSQMSYAEAIQEEGVETNRWRSSWKEGGRLWGEYARRYFESSDGLQIRLADQELWEADAAKLVAELEGMIPDLATTMKSEAEAKLTDEQQALLKQMPREPSEEQYKLHEAATELVNITPAKIASRIARDKPELAAKAQTLANQIKNANARAVSISINRDVANYEYWQLRCEIEQSDQAIGARDLARKAKLEFEREANLIEARKLYEQSFVLWKQAMDKFSGLPPDSTFGGDLMEFVDGYSRVLEQLELSLADEEVAVKFALWDVLIANDPERKYADAIDARTTRNTGIKPGESLPIDPGQSQIF